MRPDQQRVQTLLTDTVTLLCKNGLQYKKELKVQGLLGITLDDDDVFIVHINKSFDDIRGKVSAISSSDTVKVTNIPPSNSVGDYEDPVSFFDNIRSKVSSTDTTSVHVTNIPPTTTTTIGDYENVDGKALYEEDKVEPEPVNTQGMQLPVIHSLSTGIMNRSVAKKKTTKGVKRPVGAAKRKEQRSVKQRLAPSFAQNYGIQMKDEPPDEMVIAPTSTDGNDNTDNGDSFMTNGEHSIYTPGQDSRQGVVTYNRYEDCDSPAGVGSSSAQDGNTGGGGGEAMDMIECLLYNEGVEQSESGHGIYKKIRISGAEDSPLDGQDEDEIMAGYSGWDESQEALPQTTATTTQKTSRGGGSKSTSSPSAIDESVTYHGITRQDVNDSLAAQYKDLLEVAALQGDGYPCVECDQILKTRAIWMEHMKGVHMNRKYACPHCGETFKWRSSRKRHILITHSESEFDKTADPSEVTEGISSTGDGDGEAITT